MNFKTLLLFFIVPFFWSCSAQKRQISIEEVQLDSLIEIPLFSLRINDYDLSESILHEYQLEVNDQGVYYYKDSVLVNAEIEIILHKSPEIKTDSIADDEAPLIAYGVLEGKIINGKKEGEWTKKIKNAKSSNYVTVKVLHYSNGVLEGKYQVFNTSGELLFFIVPHPLFPEEYKGYEVFENGTGFYYDYYYQTGVLKEKGFYKNGKKHLTWQLFDENGNEIKREEYRNGVLIVR